MPPQCSFKGPLVAVGTFPIKFATVVLPLRLNVEDVVVLQVDKNKVMRCQETPVENTQKSSEAAYLMFWWGSGLNIDTKRYLLAGTFIFPHTDGQPRR